MLPVAPGEKVVQRRVCLRWKSAALKGAEVRGHGGCGTSSSQKSKRQRDLQVETKACAGTRAFVTLMKADALSLLWFLLCCKLSFIFIVLFGSSHLNTKPRPSSMSCYFYTCLSLLPFFSVFFSARSTCRFRPSLLSSIVPSFLSSCRRGTQPNVKRGNLTVSLASAAFTPTVCTTRKVK